MASLEDAITVAKCAVNEGDTLIIDRTKFASRKRGRISVISRGKEKIAVKDESLHEEVSSEVTFWRDKYESLRLVKFSAEEELETQLELMTEREAKLETYAKLLEQKIEIMKESGHQQPRGDLNDKLDGYRKKISFFEMMTSMTIKCEGNSEYVCTVKNKIKKAATRFKIVTGEESVEPVLPATLPDVQYTPMANADLLPEYLQSEISFETAMAPVLLGDILQSLYEDSS